MKNNMELNEKEKKSSKRKYITATICFLLLMKVGLTVAAINQEPKPDTVFEKAVREAAAKQINKQIVSQINHGHIKFNVNRDSQEKTDPQKSLEQILKEAMDDYENRVKTYLKQFEKDPNELTDDDFAKVKTLGSITGEFYDIKYLEKFMNLESLSLSIYYPKNAVQSQTEKGIIDLNPLRKLSKLKSLIIYAPVNNIEPLSELHNLEYLQITSDLLSDLKPIENLTDINQLILLNTNVSDIEPVRNLNKIEHLTLWNSQVSDIDPLSGMTELKRLSILNAKVTDFEPLSKLTNLESLELVSTKVTDLKPIKNLANLRKLDIRSTMVVDYEPLKSLPKLESLWVSGPIFKTMEDIEEFHKVLPNVKLRGLPRGLPPSNSNKEK